MFKSLASTSRRAADWLDAGLKESLWAATACALVPDHGGLVGIVTSLFWLFPCQGKCWIGETGADSWTKPKKLVWIFVSHLKIHQWQVKRMGFKIWEMDVPTLGIGTCSVNFMGFWKHWHAKGLSQSVWWTTTRGYEKQFGLLFACLLYPHFFG